MVRVKTAILATSSNTASVVDGLGGILAPGKRPVAGAQHGGHMHRVDAAPGEGLQNHLAGVPLVILVNFFGRQLPRAGHGPVKIIGVGGAKGGQVPPRLGKGHRVGGVGMHDAPSCG